MGKIGRRTKAEAYGGICSTSGLESWLRFTIESDYSAPRIRRMTQSRSVEKQVFLRLRPKIAIQSYSKATHIRTLHIVFHEDEFEK